MHMMDSDDEFVPGESSSSGIEDAAEEMRDAPAHHQQTHMQPEPKQEHGLPSHLPIRPGPGASPHGPVTSEPTLSRKRRRSVLSHDPISPAPPKRQKSTFSRHYVTLLNQDIRDATLRAIGADQDSSLHLSQVGSVTWSSTEKAELFTAVGRLGRDDLPGISSRIGTKSELEVYQYLKLLEQATESRLRDDDRRHRHLKPVDFPAANEIGQECCNALELVGDDLALRQEAHETNVEARKWGPGKWLVTTELVRDLERKRQLNTDALPFAGIFHVRKWLTLSDRIFMNSAVPDGNWRSFSEEYSPPAIRSTALTDFHALTVSITRRLVSAVLHNAHSRIRNKVSTRVGRPTRPVVKTKDVKAAIASLAMKQNHHDFWALSARRLRLNVVDDDDEEEAGDENESEEEEGEDNDIDVLVKEEEQEDPDGFHQTEEEDEEEDQDLSMLKDEEQEDPIPSSSEEEFIPMTYNQVETALCLSRRKDNDDLHNLSRKEEEEDAESESDDEEEEEEDDSISSIYSSSPPRQTNDDHNQHLSSSSPSQQQQNQKEEDEDEEAGLPQHLLSADLEEALTHTHAHLLPGGTSAAGTTRHKRALRSRIAAEIRHDMEAEALDARRGWEEEISLRKGVLGIIMAGDAATKLEEEEEEEEDIKMMKMMTTATPGRGTEQEQEDEGPRARDRGLVDHVQNVDWREGLRVQGREGRGMYRREWEGRLTAKRSRRG